MKNRSLAARLIFLTLATTAAIFAAAFLYGYYTSKAIVVRGVEDNVDDIAFATANKVETVLQAVEKVPLNLSYMLEKYSFSNEDLIYMVKNAVSQNPEVFGITVALDPDFIGDEDTELSEVYCCRDKERGTRLVFSMVGPRLGMDWYQIPKELDRPVWTEPYYDEGGGNIIMSTYSVPLHRMVDGERKFCGIVAADISLSWLKEILSHVKVYETGYAFVVSRNGVFVSHPDSGVIMRRSIFSLAEEIEDTHLRRLGQDMTRGGTDFVRLNHPVSGKNSWLYYTSVPTAGWSVGVIFPDDELYAGVRKLSEEILFIFIVGFLFLVAAVAFISRSITRPIERLAASSDEIARGNLDIELPAIETRDEIGRLAESFENMKTSLKEYIADLARTTAAKERIESELKIARTIQMSFLPRELAVFPREAPVEIYAQLQPAKEIGGDLYDFFPLDEDRLFFSIGDVSGKGIPAALFMAAAKTLMKGKAGPGVAPSDLLNSVNRELCSENHSMMFVTAFCGILDVRTGELVYSNAGHLPPLLAAAEGPPEWLPVPAGTPLGIFEDAEYETFRARVRAGDILLVYTDGVTEAMNAGHELYSSGRLIGVVQESGCSGPEDAVKKVFQSVEEFSSGLPQTDDIAVLAIRFRHAV